MRRSRGVTLPGEGLVQGLNHHERLVRAEAHMSRVDALLERVEELESAVRRLQMPWYVRWLSGLRRGAGCLVLVLASCTGTNAQSDVPVLLGTTLALATADVITTTSALTLGAQEGNRLMQVPVDHAVYLSLIVGSAVFAEMLALHRIHTHNHKAAVAIGVLVVVLKAYAVANNVRVLGEVEARRRGAG